jgi:O-antigen/teichoic acid export membrane protein
MSITTGTAANLAGSVVPALVSLATVPLYIHLVGQERYGILVLIWLLVGYFGFFDLGLGPATTQRFARFATADDDARARVFWTAFLLSAAFGVLGGIVLWPLSELVLGAWVHLPPDLRVEALGVVPWLAASVPLLTVWPVLTGALQGREQFALLNLAHVSGTTASQVAPLAVAILWGPDIRLLVPAVLVTRALTCLVLLSLCRRYVPLRSVPVISRTLLRPLLSYGSWVTVSDLLGPLLASLDQFFIGALAGTRAVTQYSVPSNLVSKVVILPASLSSVLFPRLAAETPDGRGALVERALSGLSTVITPVILAAMVGVRPFLGWWIGDEFARDAATVGEIIAVGLWLHGLAYVPCTLLLARGQPDLVAKCHLLELPAYLALLWTGLQFWGVIGAAVAWSLRVGIDAGLLFWLSRAELRRLTVLTPNVMLLLAMAVAVFALPSASHWRWALATTVLATSAVWSWWSSAFHTGRFLSLRVPARTGP